MLNELCQLADALEKANVSPKSWHPKLRQLPNASAKKPCYRICIAEDGAITNIDPLPNELVPNLRKWEPSNGDSFPGFNIQPLYRLTKEEQKKSLKAWQAGKIPLDFQLLKQWCNEATINWDGKHINKLTKCVHKIPNALSELMDKNEHSVSLALNALVHRVIRLAGRKGLERGAEQVQQWWFRSELEKYVFKKIERGEAINELLPVLVHEGSDKKKLEEDKGSISVFLDVPDWKDFPVSHLKTVECLNQILIDDFKEENKASNALDAFGTSLLDGDEKLPSVKLPIIADVKLRAMNSESPCQYRYRSIDAGSFPVGRKTRERAKGALEWLGDPSREGETWGRADTKELIFAYPVQLPEINLRLAACFGAQKNEDQEPRFAVAAKKVIDGLKASAKDLGTIDLRVFSLRKMDKARTKVVFYRHYTAQRLVDASNEWENGCRNIPEIYIRVWGEKKGERIIDEPKTLFPLQFAQCLNRIWKLNGKTECGVPAIAPSDGISLLLEEADRRIPRFLSILIQNGKGLFLSLGDMLHRGEIISVNGYDGHKLLLPSIVGLLLYKQNIRKENYVNKAPFLVGKMLKLADELHALYCREVRDNKLPPQLIGNTLMTAALESPVQAVAQLALRLKPYYGWAQTFKGNEHGNLAGYFVSLYGEVASQLSNQELPARLNDAERAQVLLGYLAANSKKKD